MSLFVRSTSYFIKRLNIISPLLILFISVLYLIVLVLDSIRLTQKHDSLASNVAYYSFMAEKLKMRKDLMVWGGYHSNERVDNELTRLLIGGDVVFNISTLKGGVVLIEIKNVSFSKLLDAILILSYYHDVDINNITIYRVSREDNGDIINGTIYISVLSKGV
ncbi:hypothetical protein [Yersinia aleksiciae]|uniref:General secretion pathway protein M n=1 Tax=Yersinia aleksiciae TaxID=263819 RepID=A0ABM5UAT8_YERAE|nr:hypothetical protein [Yersinia aleksiciae]AKP32932.1 hypothetical protein ACZ76_04925 [Yersinia aleksiciae]MDA5498957.1 hypothetical protein [Yersinia aleksiciae]NIK99574.1 hypothetical protein [Yersinia aleksiciae]WQC71425.1 hypothetical protein N0K21_02810 [Yersinia aleksiciae]CFQ52903.1 membrane protein [Yersinia aleksiciae]